MDQVMDFETVSTEELNKVLAEFYAEASPKFSEKNMNGNLSCPVERIPQKLNEKHSSRIKPTHL